MAQERDITGDHNTRILKVHSFMQQIRSTSNEGLFMQLEEQSFN